MRPEASGVDLVCGPDSPLPEARERYRLLYHLGSGGQAEVYRGVRLSAGVSSSPVTVKVFRADPRRQMLDQLRSWDKGDAVLMDLNSRGVAGICLRVDGFYGLPPSVAGTVQLSQDRVPYQVLDYLPGGTLIERLAGGMGASGPARLFGASVLATIAETLYALHYPADAGDSPVLHMDVKPSNVIVLPIGEVRLIDFTSARYDHAAHITTIAHTPESAGPEAYTGHVNSAYDVHGFGSVAYFLLTGWLPRSDRSGTSPGSVSPGGLRRHPLLDEHPVLAAHLLAPLADRPEDRPRTDELPSWIAELCALASRLPEHVRFVDWDLSAAPRLPEPSGRLLVASEHTTADIASPAAPTRALAAPAPTVSWADASALAGTASQPPAAFGSGRAALPRPAVQPVNGAGSPGGPPKTTVQPGGPPKTTVQSAEPVPGRSRWAGLLGGARKPGAAGTGPGSASAGPGPGSASAGTAPASGAPASAPPKPPRISASAPVPVRAPKPPSRFADRTATEPARPAAAPPEPSAPIDPARFKRGWRFTRFGVIVAVVCWAVWIGTVLINHTDTADPFAGAGIAVASAIVVYWLTRLAGRMLRNSLNKGPRRGTLVPHLTTALSLVLCGMMFLSFTPLSPPRVYAWVANLGLWR
ncbi:MAG: eukaryotic-like serine/threonine-protein kinase [Cryptosporangiaceae bacterium]|nr:eukaryotic-like serine/threonine-protein kinase [Cryptosporangiaceae bacterium]